MAQSGYTPIQLYYSTTATNIPTAGNLANGELAINIADGKIYYKNSSGVVTLFGSSGDVSTISFGTTGLTPSTATGGAVTVAGTLVVSNGGTGLTSLTAGYIPFGSGTSAFGNSANLFWDSANARLGIGTSIPLSQLNVYKATTGGNIRISSNTDSAYGELIFSSNNATYEAYGASISSLGDGGGVDSGNLMFNTGQGGVRATKMTLSGTGNLGLGVTPSAWTGGVKAIQIANGGFIGSAGQYLYTGANANFDTSWKYIASSYATRYDQDAGTHKWYTAPSGTAGNAITFTQAMTLNASGQLGIGTTSPTTQLEIKSAAFTDSEITLDNTSSNTTSRVLFKAAGTEYGRVSGDSTQVTLQAANIPMVFRVNSAERMRITSTGDVGIGTNSPTNKLHVNSGATGTALVLESSSTYAGLNLKNSANSGNSYIGANGTAITFDNAGAERMRIDSSGNVQVGMTSGARKLNVLGYIAAFNTGGGNDSHIAIYNDGSTSNIASTYTSTGSYLPMVFQTGGSEAMRIDSSRNALFAKAVRATITTDNDLSFDMNAASNFKCTPTGGGALTFTNITSGQTGNIILVNGSNYAITAAATTKVSSTCLATISATGTYWLSYYTDGTNVYVANTGALA